MPKKLVEFLKSLNDTEAAELWDWLDSNPDAIEEMIMETMITHAESEEENIMKLEKEVKTK